MTILPLMAVTASLALGVAQDPQPDVTIYRSWQAPDITLVEGLFRVDRELLGTEDCAYEVQLTVRDETGTELADEQWAGRCPVADGRPVAALETFRFQVVPAAYTVEIAVYPEGQPERKRTRELEVRGFADEPLASDLILAHEVGFIDTVDADRWTLRRGTIGLHTSSQMVVLPDAPELAYYLELYPEVDEPVTGTVFGAVKRPDGRQLARFVLQELDGLEDPRPIAGQLSVAGLPPGAYRFEMELALADTALVLAHPFYVGAAPVRAAPDAGWFATLSDEQLTELFDPIVVWLTAGEAELYRSLPPAGRREFLARQFGRTGPTPDDDDESALDAYLSRLERVNARYGERAGRGTQDAWRTDRGRIYLLRGEPSQQASRPSPAGGAPYEIWSYSDRQQYVYLFADETRMGHFRLIHTNDPNEQGVPDWTRRIGADALNDLERMGYRPPADGSEPMPL